MDEETARAAERAREQFPARPAGGRVVFGFDGYVDRVREVVADRHDPETYDRLDTLAGFDERVNRSVETGSSLSFEWLQDGTRTGGHTSHLSRVFGTWGYDPVMIGMYGRPELDVFTEEFGDYERFSLGEPGYTDAVEFDDGKLMLIEIGDTKDLDWERLTEAVDRETLVDRLDGADLLGTGYWAETPDLPDVLEGLRDLWDEVDDPPETVLVDPGDVRKLDRDRLRAGREALGRLDDVARVVVSANRAETKVLADTLGDADPDDDADAVGDAEAVAEAVDASLVVSHGIDRSVVVAPEGTTSVAVPKVDEPELTTSSGDHFNAGVALALIEGMDPAAAVVVGNAVAGQFVRTGDPPTVDAVRSFVEAYAEKF